MLPLRWGVLHDDLVLLFAERNISTWRRANPPNVSFGNPLRWQIFIINSVDKTKPLICKHWFSSQSGVEENILHICKVYLIANKNWQLLTLSKFLSWKTDAIVLLIRSQCIVWSVHEITRWQLSFQSTPLHTLREYHQRASQQTNVSTFISSCYIQGCPDPCRCTIAVGIMDAATRVECREKHLQAVPRHLPFSTAKL